jgi:mannose/fructose/N-acetylgalactosamine-specific phosphotransferase system component IIB
MPSDLLDRLQRILIFADKVADEIVYEETEILEKTIPRMFKVMEKVAKCSCDYVKRGRFGRQSAFLNLANADDRREDVEWARPPGEDRRNGQRVDQGH